METIITDVIGASMYAKDSVNAFRNVDKNGNGIDYLKTFSPGQLIGTVDTYLNRSGKVWWSFYDPIMERNFYVKHIPGYLEIRNQHGTVPVENHFYNDFIAGGKLSDSIFQILKPVAKWGLIAYLGKVAVTEILKTKN